jgi:hypothetical protein
MRAHPFIGCAFLASLGLLLTVTQGVTTAQRARAANPGYGTGDAAAADYALQFDFDDDLVSVRSHLGDLEFDYAFTVEAWVKPSSLAGAGDYKGIVCGGFNDTTSRCGDWKMSLSDGDYSKWGLGVCTWTKGCETAYSGTYSLLLNRWQHLAGTYDGSNILTYRNGTPVANLPHSGHVNVGGEYILFGIVETSFCGLIDEVRLWDVARSQAQIQSDMHRVLRGDEPGLVGYWRFNEGSGQEVHDLAGYDNYGRLGASSDVDIQDPLWALSDVPILRHLLYLPLVVKQG